MKTPAWIFIGWLLWTLSASAQQADQAQPAALTLINRDGVNIGLNDPTAAAPVGGNSGTTVGEQRRIIYQFAMDLWGAVLRNPVEIRVRASFSPLDCSEDKGTLGQAYALDKFATTHGLRGVRYHSALANAVDGRDLRPAEDEINSQFNSILGGTKANGSDCLRGSGWYYGLDGKIPAGKHGFLNVVMHEIGHGLGFAGDTTYGGDIFTHFAYDNVRRSSWDNLTNRRRDEAKLDQNVVFRSPHVHEEVPLVLDPRVVIRFSGAIQHDVMRFSPAIFGPRIQPGVFIGRLTVVNDGEGDPADACQALAPGSLTGQVAFINRGDCQFEFKAKNAQEAGAIAVIFGNVATSDKPEETGGMGHATDPAIRANIPGIWLSLTEANVIRNAPAGDITAQAINVLHRYQGADDNDDPYLFAPLTFQPGSTFSHFDELSSPNLLMEPTDKPDVGAHVNLDLTPALLADEGWVLNQGNGMIGTCDTGVRAVVPGGKIIGANLQAYARLCVTTANGSRSKYLRCMTDHASELKNAKLIDNAQFAQIRSCAARVQPVAQH